MTQTPEAPPQNSWVVISRSACHLCDQMVQALDREGAEFGLEYTIIDIDQDPELQRRFSDVVPVLLRDGIPVVKIRLEPGALKRLVLRRRV